MVAENFFGFGSGFMVVFHKSQFMAGMLKRRPVSRPNLPAPTIKMDNGDIFTALLQYHVNLET
jgi:hypothetical protein